MSLSKKSKTLLLGLLIIVIATYSVYKYTYKPHKTIDDIELKFSGNATDFLSKIKEDNTVFNDAVVQIKGEITSIDGQAINLKNAIFCQMDSIVSLSELKVGQKVEVKGRMIGYDDLLEETKLDKTIIIK
jgi:hypothetical protein